jgi:energy-coupling factor transporter transmembrane protein EcfT
VGYNPYRRFKAKPADYVLVAVCIVVAAVLLVWALTG